mgnify:CR=1 FL=1
MHLVHPEQKIDAKEAGRINGVSAKQIIRWAQAGMPHYHPSRKKYLFYQSEIQKFMDAHFGVNRNIIPLQHGRASNGR